MKIRLYDPTDKQVNETLAKFGAKPIGRKGFEKLGRIFETYATAIGTINGVRVEMFEPDHTGMTPFVFG